MKIVLLHYRYLPSLAGVELIMGEHARILSAAGHEVTVVAASGEAQGVGERVVRLPELETGGQEVCEESFEEIARAMEAVLAPWCEGADRVIVHNMLTMPFHLPATVALWRLADRLPPGRFVHWMHDLAAAPGGDDLPRVEGAHGELRWPWRLLAKAHPKVPTVAISNWRAEQFERLTGQEVQAVVPNGVDPLSLLPLTEPVRALAREHRLLEAGCLLFQPARLVPRKRVETGLRLIHELRGRGKAGLGGEHGARLLVTAAPDEHRPEAARYRENLLALRRELGLEREVLFLHEHFRVDHTDLSALYSLSDVLWFPSQQEGFGLPIVEGAVYRLPVFCADLPPMNRFDLPGGGFFDPEGAVEEIADQFLAFWEQYRVFMGTRKAAVERFSWGMIAPQVCALVADPFSTISPSLDRSAALPP